MYLSLELSLFLCVLLLLSISTNGQKPTKEDNDNNWQVVSNETKVMEQGGAAEEGGRKRVIKRIKVTRRRIVGGGTEQESGNGTRPAPETEAATLQPTSNGTENAGNGTDPVRTVIDWRDQRSSRICGEDNGEWHFFDGFCYQLLTGSFGWDEALAECQNRSASLASIHSKQENHFVAALSTKFEQNFDDFCHGFWIGMTRKVADKDRELFECLWADGTAVGFGNAPRHSQYFMPPWRGGEPDNAGGKEECVQQYPWLGCDGQPQIFYAQWNDFSCSSKLNGAVCKKRVPITRGP